MNIVELNNVCKSYGTNSILKDFNFSLEKGEIVAIMGDSGKGKSTLLNIIGLLDGKDSGDLTIGGHKNPHIADKEATLLKRNVIGYLFQNFALVDNLSVSKNLDIALKFSKIKDKDVAKTDVLKKVGLENKMNSKIYELSGGEQQRIAIARLMLKPCELVLADEPTGSLDSNNREIVIKLLCELHKSGKSILVVTHDKYVAEHCERIVKL